MTDKQKRIFKSGLAVELTETQYRLAMLMSDLVAEVSFDDSAFGLADKIVGPEITGWLSLITVDHYAAFLAARETDESALAILRFPCSQMLDMYNNEPALARSVKESAFRAIEGMDVVAEFDPDVLKSVIATVVVRCTCCITQNFGAADGYPRLTQLGDAILAGKHEAIEPLTREVITDARVFMNIHKDAAVLLGEAAVILGDVELFQLGCTFLSWEMNGTHRECLHANTSWVLSFVSQYVLPGCTICCLDSDEMASYGLQNFVITRIIEMCTKTKHRQAKTPRDLHGWVKLGLQYACIVRQQLGFNSRVLLRYPWGAEEDMSTTFVPFPNHFTPN